MNPVYQQSKSRRCIPLPCELRGTGNYKVLVLCYQITLSFVHSSAGLMIPVCNWFGRTRPFFEIAHIGAYLKVLSIAGCC